MKSAKKKIFTSVLTAMMLMVTLIPSMAFADDSDWQPYDTANYDKYLHSIGQGQGNFSDTNLPGSSSARTSIYFFHGSADEKQGAPKLLDGYSVYDYVVGNDYGYEYDIETDASTVSSDTVVNRINDEFDSSQDIKFGFDINGVQSGALVGQISTILGKFTVKSAEESIPVVTDNDDTRTVITSLLKSGQSASSYYIPYDVKGYYKDESGNIVAGSGTNYAQQRGLDLFLKIDKANLKPGTSYKLTIAKGVGAGNQFTAKDIEFNFSTAPVITVADEDKNVTLQSGEQKKLTPTIEAEEGYQPVWESSDESVATVAEDGTVTALAAGEARVTVKSVGGSVSADYTVTVKEAEVVGPTDDSAAADGENADEDLTAAGVDDEENADAVAKTGDYMSIAIPVCLILAAMAAAAAVIYRRKTADK